MDPGRDKTKPPSTSYRKTFRRHRKLFCMPVVLGALAAAFFLFAVTKSYRSSASLWVDTTPPSQSSVGVGSSVLVEPPASAEQGILSELLTTGSFDTSVAENSLLGKSLGSVASIEKNAPALLSKGQVVPTVQGNQILQVSYSASSPAMAQSVLAAVVTQLRDYTGRLTSQHDRAAVAYATAQAKTAENAVARTRGNVAAYQAAHPGVTQADPNYAALVAAENGAVGQLAQANTALAQASATGNAYTGGWLVRVIDPPASAGSPPLGKKKIVELIFGGALGGLLVSFLAVVALTPAKREVWEDELPVGAPFAPDVPGADPFRTGSPGVAGGLARSPRAAPGVEPPRLSLGDRRVRARAPSGPTEEP